MIADRSKRRAAGRVKWAINKLLAHADMAVKVPKAALSQVLPSAQQCCRLAEGLGAALVELEKAPDAHGARSCPAPGWAALRWNARKPKRPGWWWYRHSLQHEAVVLHVFWDENDRTLSVRTGDYASQVNFLENFDGWWAGPLVEPEEPSRAATPPNDAAQRP